MKNTMKTFAIAVALALVGAAAPASAEICGTPQVVTLFAGQTIDAGTVTVSNDENNLYVTFSSTNGWLLSETHLHVADSLAGIPTNKKGNPKIGNFTYQTSYEPPVTEDTYVIPYASLSVDDNRSVTIAAHAVVVQLDGSGNIIESETGWADGENFVDRGSWATYFQYQWQLCNGGKGDGEGTETAFAFGGNDYATCFIGADFDGVDGDDGFNRWGWSNGPLTEGAYSFEIYAGAGQCDLTKGTFVGWLDIVYENGTATVTFTMTETDSETGEDYNLVETHLHVGNEPLARDVNGEYTVAPGQYSNIHGELMNVLTDEYTVTGLEDEIYVTAHATVAGFPSEE
jgi:hypothetical protein